MAMEKTLGLTLIGIFLVCGILSFSKRIKRKLDTGEGDPEISLFCGRNFCFVVEI